MLIFLSELFGTALLIVLGDGAVANATLDKSGMKGAGSVQITLAWGLAVLVPVFIFGESSGAHLNPAITLAFLAEGSVNLRDVPAYVGGQFAGAFIGGLIVWILFKSHLDSHSDAGTKLGVFATRPSVPHKFLNFLSELTGTFILVFAILGIANVAGIAPGVDKLFIFAIIVAVGMSLGGLTGYAINPARDLAPRLVHALMPIKNKGSSDWSYSWIPLLAPICGALLAVLCFDAIPWKN